MNDLAPSPGTATGLSKDRDLAVHEINVAIDEIHLAVNLADLIENAACHLDHDGIAWGAVLVEKYLRVSLVSLVAARVALGGPDAKGSVMA